MSNFLDLKIIRKFELIFIVLFALALRSYGINWDQNQHLHPDERFLTMTTNSMIWPESLSIYLNPSISKLNPYNVGAGFYVYGTLPTTIVKYFSRFEMFDIYQYNNIALTGRLISTVFDIGVVLLVFLIAKSIFNRQIALLASFFYSISVLPIQLSHFFVTDTFLNFFLVLSFYLLILLIMKNNVLYGILLGLTYGGALACKISALYFIPVIVVGLAVILFKTKKIITTSSHMFLIIMISCFSFRIFDPHAFANNILFPKINPLFVQNISQLKSFSDKNTLFPPSIQWINITPIYFPLKNMILWGLGLPLGIVSIAAIIYSSSVLIKKNTLRLTFAKYTIVKDIVNLLVNNFGHLLILFWVLFLFSYQAIQFSPSMRYFLPIYPFVAILSANFLYSFFNVLRQKIRRGYIYGFLYFFVFLLLLIYPLSFLSIYGKPHSRVMASEWIYQNIPVGSVLSCDAWDDCLPLNIEGVGYANQYQIIGMEPFAPDTTEKQMIFEKQLQQLDYLVLTSNRAWGSLTKIPDKYPFMSNFYENIFAENISFIKVAEITSYPTIPFLNIPLPDDSSEEAFTVYDHPKVMIYKNTAKNNVFNNSTLQRK